MADNPISSVRDNAKRRAQNHFQLAAERDATVKDMIAAERKASDVKTAKLRALRLAKEEADREAARLTALNAPPTAIPAPHTRGARKNIAS